MCYYISMGRKANGKEQATERIPVTPTTYNYVTFLKERLSLDAKYDTTIMELVNCYVIKHHIKLPDGGADDADKS